MSVDDTVLSGARPLYKQVRDNLRARIVAGTYPPGHYLPTEAQLSEEFQISVGTVRKSMDELVQQGLLERLHGRGTRVVTQSSARARFRFFRLQRSDGRRFVPRGRIKRLQRRRPTAAERELFDISTEDRVIAIQRDRRDGEETLAVETIVLPTPLFKDIDLRVGIDLAEELYVIYQQQCGVTIVAATDEITAELADDEMASALSVPRGAPLLRITRQAFSLDGRVVETRITRTASLGYRVRLD
jgi:GntR family transcriptional regulator